MCIRDRHSGADQKFYTPGIVYRPQELKTMTLLMGNSESRTVYRNFELLNLHVNLSERSHKLYNKYLCYNRFLPPDESRYFAHLTTNTLAPAPGSTELQKGSFNVFPVNLATEELSKSSTSSLGKVFLGGDTVQSR